MCKRRTQTSTIASDAFTFVEVLAALAVVSISLVGLLKLHLVSIRMADTAEVTSRAVLLAQERIAETLAMGFPEVGVNAGVIEEDTPALCWRTEVSDFQLPQLAGADVAGLREVLVDITWKQGIGYKRLQMSTCVADRKFK